MSAATCLPASRRHVVENFRCFGADCSIDVEGDREAALQARSLLHRFHARFSRFDPASELSRLNDDPRYAVRASADMVAFVRAGIAAAHRTGGLVDFTLAGALERAGYVGDLMPGAVPLRHALTHAPPRRPARPDPEHRWLGVSADAETAVVTRPPGVRLDSGGLKGLFADLAGAASRAARASHRLRRRPPAGRRTRAGGPGTEPVRRPGRARVCLRDGGVATSGIGRRSWLDARGAPAHHVLDPSTGHPAFTGIVQVTALAPTALGAEVLAKAALLSGPDAAARWLAHGGVVIYDDGAHEVVAARP